MRADRDNYSWLHSRHGNGLKAARVTGLTKANKAHMGIRGRDRQD